MTIRLQTTNGELVEEFPMPVGWGVLPDGYFVGKTFYTRIGVANKKAIFREGVVTYG